MNDDNNATDADTDSKTGDAASNGAPPAKIPPQNGLAGDQGDHENQKGSSSVMSQDMPATSVFTPRGTHDTQDGANPDQRRAVAPSAAPVPPVLSAPASSVPPAPKSVNPAPPADPTPVSSSQTEDPTPTEDDSIAKAMQNIAEQRKRSADAVQELVREQTPALRQASQSIIDAADGLNDEIESFAGASQAIQSVADSLNGEIDAFTAASRQISALANTMNNALDAFNAANRQLETAVSNMNMDAKVNELSDEVKLFSNVRNDLQREYVKAFVGQLAEIYRVVWENYDNYVRDHSQSDASDDAVIAGYKNILTMVEYFLSDYPVDILRSKPGAAYDLDTMEVRLPTGKTGVPEGGTVRASVRTGFRYGNDLLLREIVEISE